MVVATINAERQLRVAAEARVKFLEETGEELISDLATEREARSAAEDEVAALTAQLEASRRSASNDTGNTPRPQSEPDEAQSPTGGESKEPEGPRSTVQFGFAPLEDGGHGNLQPSDDDDDSRESRLGRMPCALAPGQDCDSITDDFSSLALGTLDIDLKENAAGTDETWGASISSLLDRPVMGGVCGSLRGPRGSTAATGAPAQREGPPQAPVDVSKVRDYEPMAGDAHSNLFSGLHLRRPSYELCHYGTNPLSPHVCHLPGCDKPGFVEAPKPEPPMQ